MITAEILKTCTLTCQEGSVVKVTEQQFRALGNAARRFSGNVTTALSEVPDAQEVPEAVTKAESADAPENVEKPVENVENAPEIPEAALAPETPEKKSTRRKKE